jgi:lipopolysaccharide export system permease protein
MSAVLGRYLRREILIACGAIGIVLVIILFSGLLTDVLSKIARGHFPASLLLPQIALRLPQALVLLLPLAAFLAVVMAYGRLYRDAEMAVLAASGYGEHRLLGPALLFGVPLALLTAGLSLQISPQARDIAAEMAERANRELAVAGLEPGRFIEMSGSGIVVYASELDTEARQLADVLILRDRLGQLEVIRAAAGAVHATEGGATELELVGGERVALPKEGMGIERAAFDGATILLPEQLRPDRVDPLERLTLPQLLEQWPSGGRPVRAELEARLAAPLQVLLLILLAPILARSAPRQLRWGRIVMGLLLFIVYANLSALAKAWYVLGKGPEWLGTLWVHLAMAALLAALWIPRWLLAHRARRAVQRILAVPQA